MVLVFTWSNTTRLSNFVICGEQTRNLVTVLQPREQATQSLSIVNWQGRRKMSSGLFLDWVWEVKKYGNGVLITDVLLHRQGLSLNDNIPSCLELVGSGRCVMIRLWPYSAIFVIWWKKKRLKSYVSRQLHWKYLGSKLFISSPKRCKGHCTLQSSSPFRKGWS